MKTIPTEIDCEAARLFRVEVRMRAFTEFARGTVICADPMGDGAIYVTLAGEGTYEALGRPVAIDVDDPATAGVMLAQLEHEVGEAVHVWKFDSGFRVIAPPDRHVYWCRFICDTPCKTPGEAIVAAKRAHRRTEVV